MVFVLQMDCVLFKLGTEILNKILAHVDVIVRPVLARACSSQPGTRRPVLDREKVCVGFWSEVVRQALLKSVRGFPFHCHSTTPFHLASYCFPCPKDS